MAQEVDVDSGILHKSRVPEKRRRITVYIEKQVNITSGASAKNVFLPVIVPVHNLGSGVIDVEIAGEHTCITIKNGNLVGADVQIDPYVANSVADNQIFLPVVVPVHDPWTSSLASTIVHVDIRAAGLDKRVAIQKRCVACALVDVEPDCAIIVLADE